jgi:hypothetical protein
MVPYHAVTGKEFDANKMRVEGGVMDLRKAEFRS